jgi:hypothetical protein
MSKKLRSIAAVKRDAWQAVSIYVRTRDKACITCGGSPDHAGHFQYNTERNKSLGGNALWYDVRNFHAQCVGCNNYKSGNLVPYTIFMEKEYGVGIVQELYQLWRSSRKWTRSEIEEVTREYTERLSALQ